MKNQLVIPSLSDISQDIAGPIPVDLIQKWIESDQTDATHEALLAPYKKNGTIVSSDSAGLSKLSVGKPLIEVMKLVSVPKEIIHSYGTAIGGKAVGIWVADNTQMFYDDTIDVNKVVAQMIGAQREIDLQPVQVGIGIHKGTAYEIGGGLYGVDADTIEEFTEEHSEEDEVIVSKRVLEDLCEEFQSGKDRGEMRVLDHKQLNVEAKKNINPYYPAPFDRVFLESLFELDTTKADQMKQLHEERVVKRTIVLFRAFLTTEGRLLDQFVVKTAANAFVHDICNDYETQIIKSNGALAILSCEDSGEACDLALALSEAAKKNNVIANIGVCRGEVLVFDLENGLSEIAGTPVNVASKLAEDTQERGRIFFETSVADHVRQHGVKEEFKIQKSGVDISGFLV